MSETAWGITDATESGAWTHSRQSASSGMSEDQARWEADKLNSTIETARQLASDHGENPEYDRALVELTAQFAGLPVEHYDLIARQITGRNY